MTCECCETYRENDLYPLCAPNCIYCGARMIVGIQAMRHMPPEWRTKRSREELAVWVRHGHGEAEIRALVKAKTVLSVVTETKKRR